MSLNRGARATSQQSRTVWRTGFTRSEVSAAVLGFSCVAILGFNDGGYFESSWRWAILAFAAVAALALVLRDDVAFGRLELVFLGALAALAAWTLLSSAWGIEGTEAAREAERALVYVAGSAALLAVLERTAVRALLTGVVIGTVAIATLGLGDRLVTSPKALDPLDGAPLLEPLGYANALGIVLAIGLVIALGLLLAERRRYVAGLIVAAVIVLAFALILSASRGAWLALGCGLLALVLLQPRQKPHRLRRRWLAIGAAACIAIAVLAILGPKPSLGVRSAYWRAAISDARAHLLAGSGAGSFDTYWTTHRTVEVGVQDAHSLYLETLAELGLVGFVLLVGTLVPPLIVVGAARADPNVAIAAGGYIAFLVHAGLDWDWEMPATTLTGIACAAALLVTARPLFSPGMVGAQSSSRYWPLAGVRTCSRSRRTGFPMRSLASAVAHTLIETVSNADWAQPAKYALHSVSEDGHEASTNPQRSKGGTTARCW